MRFEILLSSIVLGASNAFQHQQTAKFAGNLSTRSSMKSRISIKIFYLEIPGKKGERARERKICMIFFLCPLWFSHISIIWETLLVIVLFKISQAETIDTFFTIMQSMKGQEYVRYTVKGDPVACWLCSS